MERNVMFCCLPFGHQTNFQTKEAPSLRADPYENTAPEHVVQRQGLFLLRRGMAVCRRLHWKWRPSRVKPLTAESQACVTTSPGFPTRRSTHLVAQQFQSSKTGCKNLHSPYATWLVCFTYYKDPLRLLSYVLNYPTGPLAESASCTPNVPVS